MSADSILAEIPEHQRHLLDHWEALDARQRERLASQIRAVDFDLMSSLFAGQDKPTDWHALAAKAESPPAFRLRDSTNRFTATEAIEAGSAAIAAGKMGVILVAGGQGSRLGFDHPKGMYPIGPLSQRTLLQMHVEQTLAIARRFNVSIPLYLMTSPVTHDETVAFLEENDRFGYPETDFRIFCQGTMPAVDDQTGKLLLAAPDQLFLSPDGHGGTLAALAGHGCLDDIERRGVEQLFYFQVDNPLVEICQAEFVGYHILSDSELATQVIAKQDPLEKVGNVVLIDDAMTVIEYSDLPVECARRRDDDGNLVCWAGNIAVHVFSSSFLRRNADHSGSLPFHRAHKAVPFVNADGSITKPETPNAIKFEKFIFDLLPLAKNPIVVEIDAADVFAPLKMRLARSRTTPKR